MIRKKSNKRIWTEHFFWCPVELLKNGTEKALDERQECGLTALTDGTTWPTVVLLAQKNKREAVPLWLMLTPAEIVAWHILNEGPVVYDRRCYRLGDAFYGRKWISVLNALMSSAKIAHFFWAKRLNSHSVR